MAYASFKNGSLLESIGSEIVSSNGTEILVFDSHAYQVVIGSLNHSVQLPNATTMKQNQRFIIINASTGIVTIKDNGGNTLDTIGAGQTKICRAIDISTSNGVFDITVNASAGSGGLSASESLQFNAIAAKGVSSTSKILNFNPEDIGGNFWLNKKSMPAARSLFSTFNLNGHMYVSAGASDTGATRLTTSYRYNIDTNAWLLRGTISPGTVTGGGFSIGGFGFVSAGVTTAGGSGGLDVTYKYNDVTDLYSVVDNLETARGSVGVFASQNYGYIVNGLTNSANSSSQIDKIEAYDYVSNTWTTRKTVSISSTRWAHGSAWYGGYGYLNGGTDNASLSALSKKYNETLDAYTIAPSISSAKQYMTTYVSCGFMFSTGGGSTLNERLLDIAGIWMTMAPMSTSRNQGSSGQTDLYGYGLVAGGNPGPLSTMENYISFSLFNLGVMKKDSASPSSLSVSAVINKIAVNVPVQIRTDGDNWKTFLSSGSALKLGESLSSKFQPSTSVYKISGYNGSSFILNIERYDSFLNAWNSIGNCTTAKRGSSCFDINGSDYVIGGKTTNTASTAVAVNELFNYLLVSFTTKAPMPTARAHQRASFFGGYGYVLGGVLTSGSSTGALEQFNATLNSWLSKTAISQVKSVASQFAIDYLYSIGGDSSGSPLTDAQKYDDITEAWSAITSTVATESASDSSIGGFGYMYGGYSGAFTNATRRYNPSLDSWSSMLNLNSAIADGGGLRHDGLLYSISGSNGAVISNVEQFNPYANTWTAKAGVLTATVNSGYGSPNQYRNYEVRIGVPAFYTGIGGFVWAAKTSSPTSRDDTFGFSVNDSCYFAGGSGGTTLVTKYTPSLDSWLQVLGLNNSTYACFSASNTLLGLGYVIGGNSGLSNYNQQYTPETNSWASKATTPYGFYVAGLAPLHGYAYFLGGYNGSVVSSVYKYSPVTNAWAAAGNMSSAMSGIRSVAHSGYIYSILGSTGVSDRYSDVTATGITINSPSGGPSGNASALFSKDSGILCVFGTSANAALYNDLTNVWNSSTTPLASGSACGQINDTGVTSLNGNVNTYIVTSAVKQAVLSAKLNVA